MVRTSFLSSLLTIVMQVGWGFDDHEITWLFELRSLKINAVPTITLRDTRGNTRGSFSKSLWGRAPNLMTVPVHSHARKSSKHLRQCYHDAIFAQLATEFRIYRVCKKTEQIGNRFLLLEGPQCTKFFTQIDFLEKFKISKRGGCLFYNKLRKV